MQATERYSEFGHDQLALSVPLFHVHPVCPLSESPLLQSVTWLSSPLPEEEEWDELGELECPLVESVPRVPSLESVPDMEGDELLRSPMACMLDLLFMW